MYTKILLPVDMEHTAESAGALQIAIDEARRSNASLTVMTVAPGFGMPIVASYFDENAVSEALKEIARHLKTYIADNLPEDIETCAVVVEGNPRPLVMSATFSNANGFLSGRIKMGKTSNVVAYAKTSGGVIKATQEVKVTVGGCGG